MYSCEYFKLLSIRAQIHTLKKDASACHPRGA